jgi:hypothetical protein
MTGRCDYDDEIGRNELWKHIGDRIAAMLQVAYREQPDFIAFDAADLKISAEQLMAAAITQMVREQLEQSAWAS